jgi:hypothetical protein
MRSLVPGCALAALAAASALAQSAVPSRTPTLAPRLSGGFGRPRATPAPAGEGGGQSLADVVKAAKDARQQSENPTRERSGLTIDNRSLVTNKDKGRVSTSKAAPGKESPAVTAVPPPRAAVTDSAAGVAPSPTPALPSEAEWRELARAARTRVANAKARVGELEATVQKLENDFYAWDDGQYRDRVIKPAWDKTRDQLEDARRELAAAEKDLADLPERARRAGAAPGWIRE